MAIPYGPWAQEDIDRMLEFLPVFEDPSFVPATWIKFEPEMIGGRLVHRLPYPEYCDKVEEFRRLCFGSTCGIDPYAVLPEDPPGTQPGLETARVITSEAEIATATLDQIRRYFVLSVRAERFCDGYIEGQLKLGKFQAALRRVAELRVSRPD